MAARDLAARDMAARDLPARKPADRDLPGRGVADRDLPARGVAARGVAGRGVAGRGTAGRGTADTELAARKPADRALPARDLPGRGVAGTELAARELVASELSVPRLCELRRPSAVLGTVEWAIACQIDGRATVGELAGRNGIMLRDATALVTRLVKAGLCTITGVAASAYYGERRQPADGPLQMPRRVPETAHVAAGTAARLDPRLLRRILDGLNALN